MGCSRWCRRVRWTPWSPLQRRLGPLHLLPHRWLPLRQGSAWRGRRSSRRSWYSSSSRRPSGPSSSGSTVRPSPWPLPTEKGTYGRSLIDVGSCSPSTSTTAMRRTRYVSSSWNNSGEYSLIPVIVLYVRLDYLFGYHSLGVSSIQIALFLVLLFPVSKIWEQTIGAWFPWYWLSAPKDSLSFLPVEFEL